MGKHSEESPLDPPADKTIIYVFGLEKKIDSKVLQAYFEKFGRIQLTERLSERAAVLVYKKANSAQMVLNAVPHSIINIPLIVERYDTRIGCKYQNICPDERKSSTSI